MSMHRQSLTGSERKRVWDLKQALEIMLNDIYDQKKIMKTIITQYLF